MFVGCPGLVLSLAENEQLVSGAFEIDLIVEGLDELGEVTMNEAQIESGSSKLVGDDSSGASDSGGVKGSEVSSEGAIRVAVEDIETLEDGGEEVEGRRIRLPPRRAIMVSLESFEEGKVPLLLFEGGAVLVEEREAAFAVELGTRDGIGSRGVGADDLMNRAVNQRLGTGVVEQNGTESLLIEAESALNDCLVLGFVRGRLDHGASFLDEVDEAGLVVAGLAIMEKSVREDAPKGSVDR